MEFLRKTWYWIGGSVSGQAECFGSYYCRVYEMAAACGGVRGLTAGAASVCFGNSTVVTFMESGSGDPTRASSGVTSGV